jgi:hypothetical protein
MCHAGEHQARARRRGVQHRLRRPGRVPVDTPGDQHGKNPVAPRHRLADDLAVVGRPGDHSDLPGECIELCDALLAAHAGHLIAPVKRVPHHVLSELAGGAYNADPHHVSPPAKKCQRYCDCAPPRVRAPRAERDGRQGTDDLRPDDLPWQADGHR